MRHSKFDICFHVINPVRKPFFNIVFHSLKALSPFSF